jgi:hypothetical protein
VRPLVVPAALRDHHHKPRLPGPFASLSLLVARVTNWVEKKVDGIGLYRRAQVPVLRILGAYTAGVALSFFIDLIFFFGQGHPVHTPPI